MLQGMEEGSFGRRKLQYIAWEGWSLGAPQDPEQERTPFLDLLTDYVRAGVVPYHTPGHKQGRAAPPHLVEALGPKPFLIDLDGELSEPDPGHGRPWGRPGGEPGGRAPKPGALEEAEALAAAAFGARQARFLVNGTTAGIHALFMAGAGPGRPVILPRNVHRSLIGGLILSGARPVFVAPEYLEEAGVTTVPAAEVVAAALAREPGASALMLTAPTYYGWLPDLAGIGRAAAAAGVPLWVDEAHGALFGFHEALPPGALSSGAQAAVRSLHKGGGSLVQSSLLLLGEGGPDAARVDAALAVLQSTSPSPLLLASLDAARAWLASGASGRLERLVETACWIREALNRISGVRCWGSEVVGRAGIAGWDPTRIVFSVEGLGLSGLEAAAWLRRACKLQVEMADLLNVVVVLSLADGPWSAGRLVDGVRRLAAEARPGRRPLRVPPPPVPPAPLTPREAFFAPTRRVPLREAAGQTAAETVAPYPPGIPVLIPGEEVTPETIEYLERLRQAGARLEGGSDPTGETVLVVAGSPGRSGAVPEAL